MLRRLAIVLAVLGLSSTISCFVENIAGRYCTSDTQCTEAGYPKCDTRVKTCVPSTFDFDMGTGGMIDMTMIGCSTSATCPAAMPVCSAAQVCSVCGNPGQSSECSSNHAATPLCGPNGGCVECLTKDNCDGVHKTCSTTTNACVPCVHNADCTSGLCSAGVCADKATLLYVDNATGAGCSDTGPGSFVMPFCSVQKGLNAAAMSAKTVVVFAGGGYTENLQAATTLNGGNDYVVTAVGVGNPVVKAAAGAAPIVSVAGTTGKQVTASFDGFTFDGTPITDGSDGIDCSGNSGNAYGKTLLTLTRSTVKSASGIGVLSQLKCSLTFDADVFVGNKGGGIRVDTSDFAFTNLLVNGNGTAATSNFGGIYFSAAGESGKTNMFNLTLVNNQALSAAAGAIYCTAAGAMITNTFAFGNSGTPPEVSALCSGSFNAYIGATGSNDENIPVMNCALSDLTVSPATGDFHPKKGGTKPCTLVDQGTNTGAPDHDLDGVSRPQPASGTDDIGCYEAQ